MKKRIQSSLLSCLIVTLSLSTALAEGLSDRFGGLVEPEVTGSNRPVVIQGIDSPEALARVPSTPSRAAAANVPQGFAPQAFVPVVRQPSSNLGGGFIELLMTGRDPTPSSYASRQVLYNDPGMTQSAAKPRRQRLAALPEQADIETERFIEREIPEAYRRQLVDYSGPHKPGTIVINTSTKHLYLVQGDGKALRYGIGVGRPGFAWKGTKTISRKAEWPDWRPPAEMLKRRPDLPRFMAGGPENPLGARALYLGSSLFRIHGTNEPHTIGQAVSSGCFRMINEDVQDLYTRVRVGTRVVVM